MPTGGTTMRRTTGRLLAATAVLGALGAGAPAAGAYTIDISVLGRGKVVETTPAAMVSCQTSNPAVPTGRLGAVCRAGTAGGAYGWGWTVELRADVLGS